MLLSIGNVPLSHVELTRVYQGAALLSGSLSEPAFAEVHACRHAVEVTSQYSRLDFILFVSEIISHCVAYPSPSTSGCRNRHDPFDTELYIMNMIAFSTIRWTVGRPWATLFGGLGGVYL